MQNYKIYLDCDFLGYDIVWSAFYFEISVILVTYKTRWCRKTQENN
jgi:hypothetical protein